MISCLDVVDPKLLAQLSYVGIDKGCDVIRENVFGHSKPTSDIVSDKIGHGRSAGSFEGHCFDSLSVVLGGSKDPYVAERLWVDLVDEIEGLEVN